MKNQLRFLFAAALAVAIIGCSKDNGGSGTDQQTDGKSAVSLTIYEGKAAVRSSEGDTEPTEGNEGEIFVEDDIKVAVFNSDGSLDYAGSLTLTETGPSTGIFKSETFEVSAGTGKYFYVFVNDAGNLVTLPGSTVSRESFLTQAIATALNASDEITNVAVNAKFLMGTLWSEAQDVAGGGTTATPVTVALSVGRLSAKVNLASVATTSDNASLSGTFGDPQYRMGAIPKIMNTVGVYTGTVLPTEATGVLVESAVHNAPAYTGPSDVNFQEYTTTWKVPAEIFYTVENTTARDASTGHQYFGNTSYIQVETVYTPNDSEIYNPLTLAQEGSLTGGTFWTARIKTNPTTGNEAIAGQRFIFYSTPEGAAGHPDIDQSSIVQYTQGKNYHKFVLFEGNETDDVKKNRVLRNHYYEYTLTNFKDLGSNTSTVDPSEPVPSRSTVDITVEVKDWDKIVENVEV